VYVLEGLLVEHPLLTVGFFFDGGKGYTDNTPPYRPGWKNHREILNCGAKQPFSETPDATIGFIAKI
jgi:hypothetical protein